MPKDFDLLAQLAKFARANGVPLNDPEIAEHFAADAGRRVKAALQDRRLVYGMRTERLFEAMVVSLGKFRLLKSEDLGTIHCADKLRAPDFRLVMENGEQWLVEVKNVHREDPLDQVHEMEPEYLASLVAYCHAVGAPLLVAHFWSCWGMWTLVEADRFRTPDGGLRVEMMSAFPYSRLGDLGDVSINLPGPLRLAGEVAVTREDDGEETRHPVGLSIYRRDQLLIDDRDRKLALILLQFGDWPVQELWEERGSEGRVTVHLEASPEEFSDNGFDCVGHASRIFSRYYRHDTSAGDQVTQLYGEPRPDWFQPLAEWDFSTSQLGLRLFRFVARKEDVIPAG